MFSRIKVGAFAGFGGLLLALLAASPALAQLSTATVEVVVSDADGGALPGVSVSLENTETGFSRQAVTGASGGVSVPALPPGTYQARVELDGFAPVQQDGIVLRVGQTAQLQVTLTPAQVAESITVSTTVPLVDVYKTDSSTNIVPEQIESLPVPDRDFQRLAFIAPGVSRERGAFRFIGGGPVIGSGGNASQSTILVNGVDFTDPALGLSKIRFSQDAIGEFRVMNSRYDTEIGGTAGGALSIVTKSGKNNFAGNAFGFYRADSLRERSELEQGGNDYSRSQFGFAFGGPIRADQTHFYLSAEQIDEDNFVLFRPGGAFAPQARDVAHPFKQTLAFGKLDHRLSDANTFAANLVWERYREENFRVGGIADVSYGQELRRDNWNVTLEDIAVLGSKGLNELRLQGGHREFFEPLNSRATAEWFSSGNTLQTGGNILGDLLGEGKQAELRDTFHWNFEGRGSHDIKGGASILYHEERSRIDTFQTGLFVYITDTRALPLSYLYGEGSSDVTYDTTRYAVFLQDDWKPKSNLSLNLGVRYDLDDGGNNPGFTHPLVPEGRKKDTDDVQPRFAFSYDASKDGRNVFRGGVGVFNGRYLLIPAGTELQQNGFSGGRITRTRVNGALLGLPAFTLDPNNPTTTGLLLARDISLIAPELDTPESVQASLGFTRALWKGFFLDVEGVYSDGDNEIIIRDVNFGGNARPVRLNSAFNQINMYTNEGCSEYTAGIVRLNGNFGKGHLLTASFTVSDKKNIMDDFSPEFPFGYPNDPSNVDAEWGYSRSHEKYRFVLTGIFRLPWELVLAPIYEYGSGQPWNHRLGYDFNGDGKNSDRPTGVERNNEEGPEFRQLSLRLTKGFQLFGDQRLEVIVEGFNVLDNTNYDVNSIDTAEFLSGPTLANPALPAVRNPNFGNARATLPGREIQLGLRWVF